MFKKKEHLACTFHAIPFVQGRRGTRKLRVQHRNIGEPVKYEQVVAAGPKRWTVQLPRCELSRFLAQELVDRIAIQIRRRGTAAAAISILPILWM